MNRDFQMEFLEEVIDDNLSKEISDKLFRDYYLSEELSERRFKIKQMISKNKTNETELSKYAKKRIRIKKR